MKSKPIIWHSYAILKQMRIVFHGEVKTALAWLPVTWFEQKDLMITKLIRNADLFFWNQQEGVVDDTFDFHAICTIQSKTDEKLFLK